MGRVFMAGWVEKRHFRSESSQHLLTATKWIQAQLLKELSILTDNFVFGLFTNIPRHHYAIYLPFHWFRLPLVKITKKNYRRLTITNMVPHHGRAVEASNLNFILAMFHSWQSSMSLDQVELSGANFWTKVWTLLRRQKFNRVQQRASYMEPVFLILWYR